VIALDGGHRYRGNEFHPVPARLGHEPVGQLAARDAVGEPRVVVDLVADSGLAAQGACVHDDRVDALAGGIYGGCQPGRPAPHDDQVVGGPVGFEGEADAAGKRLVARVHLVRSVRVDHGGDDLPAVLQLLEPLDRLGIGINVDVGVTDPVGGEELLDPLAVRAPRGPVYGHDRLVRRDHCPTPPGFRAPHTGDCEHANPIGA